MLVVKIQLLLFVLNFFSTNHVIYVPFHCMSEARCKLGHSDSACNYVCP